MTPARGLARRLRINTYFASSAPGRTCRDKQEDWEMTRLARLLTMAAFAFGTPAAVVAQPASPPHQHGQQGVRQAGCECPCGEMMKQMQEMHQMMQQMMQQHAGHSGNMQDMNMMQGHGPRQPATNQGAETHQHEEKGPN
jgi:hypothetical protein